VLIVHGIKGMSRRGAAERIRRAGEAVMRTRQQIERDFPGGLREFYKMFELW
jgi:hypothetical protein